MFFTVKYKWGLLLLGIPLFFISCEGCFFFPGEDSNPEELTLMTYNVQNLFDEVNDGTEYSDFIIGQGNWSEDLFHLKLLQLSDVLILHPAGGADIILLQEIENRNSLDVLNTHYLKGAGRLIPLY